MREASEWHWRERSENTQNRRMVCRTIVLFFCDRNLNLVHRARDTDFEKSDPRKRTRAATSLAGIARSPARSCCCDICRNKITPNKQKKILHACTG
jgi:hypothetical protein